MLTYKIENEKSGYYVYLMNGRNAVTDFGPYDTEDEARTAADGDSNERQDHSAVFVYDRVNSHDLTPKQRRTLKRVIHFYKERNDYSGCTSVRFELTRPYRTFLSLVVTTRRSDCAEYSPRQVLSSQRGHFAIGIRGGLKLHNSESALNDDSKHVRYMLNATK